MEQTKIDKQLVIDMDFLKKRPLSYSAISWFKKSPKHYIEYLTKPVAPTDAMILGQAVDTLLLQPEEFNSRYLVHKKIDRRTKQGKEDWANLLAEVGKRTLISDDVMGIATTCVNAVKDHDAARRLLDGRVVSQQLVRWTNKDTQLPCKGYIDMPTVVSGELFLVDLKTTRDADPKQFERTIIDRGYQIQAGAYLDAYKHIQYKFPGFIFLCVETADPFNVSVNYCDNKLMEMGKMEWLGQLKEFKRCMEEGAFGKGYEFRLRDSDWHLISLPGWYRASVLGIEDDN